MTQIIIIDTGIGNITSVVNAFSRIGCQVKASRSKDDVMNAESLVLPGVGAFEQGMSALRQYELEQAIKYRVLEKRVPIIGICLGMQLLADESAEHGLHAGLGIVPGKVVQLVSHDPSFRIPNIGWHDVYSNKTSVMFDEDHQKEIFYHVHSFHLQCSDANDVAAHINFSGREVTVAIEKDNVFGMQFHPEKSQDDGLNLLSRIMDSVSEQTTV